jgi:hypothetical protein
MNTKMLLLASASATLMLAVDTARAQEPMPPGPFELVSQLDFECRPAQGAPPAAQVGVRQLNPVLQGKVPFQVATLGGLREVCVPVAKNGQIPTPRALAFARFLDVACYDADADPVNVDVTLGHLNPQLPGLPSETVELQRLKQLCVPVKKNAAELPPEIKAFASHFDLGCYHLAQPTADINRTLVLTHLNPVIREMGPPDRTVRLHRARQLCVPVAKNNQPVPPGIENLVRWADFLKYDVERLQGAIPVLPLVLTHLNPLFDAVPPFATALAPEPRLMVPVAKDGHLPPQD